jgi:hypothetical protein
MSRHSNKYWLREKEFISLNIEYDRLWKNNTFDHWVPSPNSTYWDEIRRRFRYKFYNEYYGRWNTSPHWYRNTLNRKQRQRSRNSIRKLTMGEMGEDVIFIDNYRGCNNYW